MSSEPLSNAPEVDTAAAAEKGLLIAMLILVLLGVAAMLFMV
ncbi:MAG TPA: hypothetical protein VFG35_16425 [Actinoplanes sp.]|nr:hypothetical protein [Actinoplanes sp.]